MLAVVVEARSFFISSARGHGGSTSSTDRADRRRFRRGDAPLDLPAPAVPDAPAAGSRASPGELPPRRDEAVEGRAGAPGAERRRRHVRDRRAPRRVGDGAPRPPTVLGAVSAAIAAV